MNGDVASIVLNKNNNNIGWCDETVAGGHSVAI